MFVMVWGDGGVFMCVSGEGAYVQACVGVVGGVGYGWVGVCVWFIFLHQEVSLLYDIRSKGRTRGKLSGTCM